jgi:hypothetical protein
MVVDSVVHEEEVVADELGSPASMAGASSCNWALADKVAMAVQIPGTDVNGVWLRWLAMVSREA